MNGGAGFLRRSEVSTDETVQTAFATSSATRSAASSSASRGICAVELELLAVEGDEARRERAAATLPASVASTDQYSTGTNASISLSRSQMIRSATVWTRPAERPRQTFFQSRSETS